MARAIAINEVIPDDIVSCRRDAMTRAVRLFAPLSDCAVSVEQLLSVPAAWSTHHHDADRLATLVPRLQSHRRGGIAPPYPRRRHLAAPLRGTLIVFSNGFVLEPSDHRHPCVNVACSEITAATFYSDAFEVALVSRERLVIQTPSVDRVDSIFQAYFWNPIL